MNSSLKFEGFSMSNLFLPTLQHMCAVKIAVFLFNEDVIQSMIEELESLPAADLGSLDRKRFAGWNWIKEEAEEKLKNLLPPNLLRSVVQLLRAMHWEVHHWVRDHPFVEVYASRNVYNQALCWRSDGAINRFQTAKNFIRNKCVYPLARFVMACVYFVEEDISSVWNEMEDKKVGPWDSNLVVRFWEIWLRRGAAVPWTERIHRHFVNPRILPSDVPMRVSCFFHLLSREERRIYFTTLNEHFVHADDLRSCMNLMDEKERTEIFQVQAVRVLEDHLKWPHQSMFMSVANQLWQHINVDRFEGVLYFFLRFYLLSGFEYFDFLSLFKEFWQASPASLKQEIMKRDLRLPVESALNYEQQSLSLQEILEKSLQNSNST